MAAVAQSWDVDGPFLGAAVRYWGSVFPFVRREIRGWERRARAIPDKRLRATAVRALVAERGNLEGAPAFAAFVPRAHRFAVARATIAFQVAYDYADAVSESSESKDCGEARRLHQVLTVALTPGASHPSYYGRGSREKDGGYLTALANACRAALATLPSFSVVAGQAKEAVRRNVAFQCFNHLRCAGAERLFARWAESHTPPGSGLLWWETAAAAGSSLSVFALMAAAACSSLDPALARLIDAAYFPWIGSLHVLLDSVVDRAEDEACGQPSLLARYDSTEQAAARIELLARAASDRVRSLSQGKAHAMLLAAMVAFYLSRPTLDPATALLATRVTGALDKYAAPAMLAMRLRAFAGRRVRPVDQMPSR